ncbi:hypothetical protein M2404_001089 [Rheinheimera pacifica]|nr:hypothetical protein [Rheinheimera pacifica]MCS4306764.1 hypothetical protein [Rheinheimera pacifica]
MAVVTGVLLVFGWSLLLAAQSIQATEYFRGRAIIGAGVFTSGG